MRGLAPSDRYHARRLAHRAGSDDHEHNRRYSAPLHRPHAGVAQGRAPCLARRPTPKLNSRSNPPQPGANLVAYPMTEDDRDIQERAREFVDELIPYEVEAEMHGGELPEEVLEKQRLRIRDLGWEAINMPRELGGGGFTTFQQFLVQEQVGRATNALGWVIHTPPTWLPKVASDYQMERWVLPTIRGEKSECYAITEEGAGSDVDAIQATAARHGDDYVLNGVKWHVTSYDHSDYVFFQGKLTEGPHAGEHAMFVMDLDTPRISVVRVPEYSHTISHHHAVLELKDARVPATHLI